MTDISEKLRLRKMCSGSTGSAALRLDEEEADERGHAERDQADDHGGAPGVLRAAPGGDEHDRGDADGQQRRRRGSRSGACARFFGQVQHGA